MWNDIVDTSNNLCIFVVLVFVLCILYNTKVNESWLPAEEEPVAEKKKGKKLD